MDESAIKGMELDSDLDAMRDRRSRSAKILVKGYDTSLHVDVVKRQLTKHFSSCGEVVSFAVHVLEDGTPYSRGYIYILGDSAEEKALQLSGSEMEGRKIVATSPHKEFIKLTPAMAARLAKAERAWDSPMMVVSGYDTSLPDADIEVSLTNHFSSCGEIVSFHLYNFKHLPIQDRQAHICIWGEGAEEKALKLNGSDMRGFKLVVVSSKQPVENSPLPVVDEFPRGYMIPARVANPKKKMSRYKMKKKKANRNKAWK